MVNMDMITGRPYQVLQWTLAAMSALAVVLLLRGGGLSFMAGAAMAFVVYFLTPDSIPKIKFAVLCIATVLILLSLLL